MRTKLGNFLLKIRTNTKKSLRQMAADLDISAAFLSAVENGNKKMPDTWFELIPSKYDLSEEEIEEFNTLAYESFKTVELNISEVSSCNKDLAITFARRFEDIDEKTSKELLDILKNRFKEDSTNE
ncbi:MAG: helix-turn-helix transcriptional regulator [Clostridiales bacterium]|nr:helix-turn-helix transcriptional regulator [Clostridiales bacterium]